MSDIIWLIYMIHVTSIGNRQVNLETPLWAWKHEEGLPGSLALLHHQPICPYVSNWICVSKLMIVFPSHVSKLMLPIYYLRLLAWSKSFFASPSASRSLWIPSLCDAILNSLFLFWWKKMMLDVFLFIKQNSVGVIISIYRSRLGPRHIHHGLMTCPYLGWNPWEWICVKRESFFLIEVQV